MGDLNSIDLDWIDAKFPHDEFRSHNEEMSFSDYLTKLMGNPKLARSAYQRIYDMVISQGSYDVTKFRKTYTHYRFFDNAKMPIFGLEPTLDRIVKHFKGGAGWYGPEKRILLLKGPVGSSKSTILRLIKSGMETYSKTDAGAWYSYKWVDLPSKGDDSIYVSSTADSPLNEDPLKLIPVQLRKEVLEKLNAIHMDMTPADERNTQYELRVDGELNPRCRKFMTELLKRYNGDWRTVMQKHIKVIRKVYSEADRTGIATFQPKDEKNQDATELTGDIDYGKLPHFGADSDPRSFNFDGELCVGNRGCCEFIEMLKLAQEFLYDLLGAAQERQIKPKKFAQMSVDMAIIGHTNEPEFLKLKDNKHMEALKDRTIKIDVPYLLSQADELKVLEHDYGPGKVRKHIAPHTLEIVALWTVLTRHANDKEHNLPLVDKVKLYDGKHLPGWNEDKVGEMMDKYPDEGHKGVSARYSQDKIAACLSSTVPYITPFIALNEIREGLENSPSISNKDEIKHYYDCYDLVTKELDQILKNEVQKATIGDEEAIVRLCANYIDNIVASINKSKIKNPYTKKDQEPDERLMRSIEEKIGVPETQAPDYRRSIVSSIGTMSTQGIQFKWNSNSQLKKALEAKLFEDTRDHIKLSALNSNGASTVDPSLHEKIDAIKQRLIKQYGYTEESATDTLNYVSGIFARGDVVED